MTTWASPYIGVRHEPTVEANCLGFARRVQREVFGRDLPGMLGITRMAVRGSGVEGAFPEIVRPEDGCIVVMGDRRNPAVHVGVWCEEAERVIHAESDFGSVVASQLATLRHYWASIRFFSVPA